MYLDEVSYPPQSKWNIGYSQKTILWKRIIYPIEGWNAFSEWVNLHLHDHKHPIKDLDLRVLSQNGPIKVLYFPESLFNWRQLFERRRQNVRESIQCPTMTLFPSSLESLCVIVQSQFILIFTFAKIDRDSGTPFHHGPFQNH